MMFHISVKDPMKKAGDSKCDAP